MKYVVFDHDGTLVNTRETPQLFEGARELLTELISLNAKIYLWTARDRNSTVRILKELDALSFFEDISTSTDCDCKPSTAGLSSMLDGVEKKDIIVIGDSLSDIVGAKNYEAWAMGACWDHSSKSFADELTKYGADAIASSVDECREKLVKWIKEDKNVR